jgi:type I restriction-modification system DNA methylase subunit
MSEELQRYLIPNPDGSIRHQGEKLDSFERYVLGATTLAQLKQAGIIDSFVDQIAFQPKIWKGSPSPASRPDELVLDGKIVKLVVERKTSFELATPKLEESASEQCLTYMQQLRCQLGVTTDGTKFLWINDPANKSTEVRYIYDEQRLFTEDYRKLGILKKVLTELDRESDSIRHPLAVDPSGLADKVWQTIWLATHEEAKLCLSTFVELFLYKFLSDLEVLPISLRIANLNLSEAIYTADKGITQIEFYCQNVRPYLKKLFPERKKISPPIAGFIEGSDTTSIIDGFAFLEPGIATHNHPLSSFNKSFMDIIKAFLEFGSITNIDSEFKSRVYEKFLKKNAKQQKLGQYLTPRNIVRAILEMADLKTIKLRNNAVICDPGSGVGGFLLEPLLHDELLKRNLQDSLMSWKVRLIGLEVDRQTNILAKANMLIHLAEEYRIFSQKQRAEFADLMNETFVLTDHDKMLGSLEFPQINAFDLIMTNIPFVVRGTKMVKERISESANLKKQYGKSGTGIESLFLRYIINALKPGSSAFVIVPTGVLTRTETSLRTYLKENCDLDAIVSLPKRSFYNTVNPTYILAFTKKLNVKDTQHSKVFVYMVREIGETRNVLRSPCRNDLKDMARQFKIFRADQELYEPRSVACKLVDIANFDAKLRWDIDRLFWTDEERRELGLIEDEVMTLNEFQKLTTNTMGAIKEKLESLKGISPSIGKQIEIALGDEKYFKLFRGRRVTRKDCLRNPGDIPVISGRGKKESYLGRVSEEWLTSQKIPVYTKPLIVIAANGNVGSVFLRDEKKYAIHDDAIGIDIVNDELNLNYVLFAIRASVVSARFQYDAKLYQKRLSRLKIKVPVADDGSISKEKQQMLANKFEGLENLKWQVEGFAKSLENKVIIAD